MATKRFVPILEACHSKLNYHRVAIFHQFTASMDGKKETTSEEANSSIIGCFWTSNLLARKGRTNIFHILRSSGKATYLLLNALMIFSNSQCSCEVPQKISGLYDHYLLKYPTLKMAPEIIGVIFRPKTTYTMPTKMTISQKLFGVQISNFRFVHLNSYGTLSENLKKI